MDFANSVIAEIITTRKSTVEGPNMDPWRFPPDRVPTRYSSENALVTIDAVQDLANEFNLAAGLFEDTASRDLMRQLLAFRALGPMHVKLPSNTPAYWNAYQAARDFLQRDSEKQMPPFAAGLYRLDFLGESIELECWLGNVVFTFLLQQYFLSRGSASVQPQSGNYVIDAGACFGDTALAFAAAVGPAGRVFSFEPIARHREIIGDNLRRNTRLSERIAVLPYALWDQHGEELNFMDASAGSRPASAGSRVRTATIDEAMRVHGIPRVDFIKMDVEGSEERALMGAFSTIRKFRPKLAISAYHNLADLVRLPILIKAIEPSYRFYLDHYTIHAEETILYAVSPQA